MSDINVLVKKIYRKVVAIREKLEIIQRILIPEAQVSKEELNKIKKLKKEESYHRKVSKRSQEVN